VATPEPVTVTAPRPVTRPVLRQEWRDVVFVHWSVDPDAVAPLLPPRVSPDVYGDTTYVGLIAFRNLASGLFGSPPVPYLGRFPEVNVRLYSVGPDGRRGVVFRSLDASRLATVTAARAIGVPYQWSRMRMGMAGDRWAAVSRRRWPGPAGASCRLVLRVGAPVEPDPLQLFLTARWGLHLTLRGGRPAYWPNQHRPWTLHAAEVLELEDDLIAAAGLAEPARPPDSVLYAPGVTTRFGPPELL
jgi:uncharacterized protein YqjF (DUF2071 family)